MHEPKVGEGLRGPHRIYERLGAIASGGMGTVYLARARGPAGFERLVAIKVLHPHLRGDERFCSSFLDEARLAARIHHPNVAPTLDVVCEGELFLVMDYVDGEPLSAVLAAARRRGERLGVDAVLRIGLDALAGLHAAHELCGPDGRPLKVVHRDVSPQNLLVGLDGVARLVDFGIAKAEERSTSTGEGIIKGKIAYMAPEQLLAQEVTRATDVYSAGVVLWEALTGRALFQGLSQPEIADRVLKHAVEPPSRHAPGVPPELDAALMRAIEANPAQRFASAAEFAQALEELDIKPAPPRAVGALVAAWCAESVARRRGLASPWQEPTTDMHERAGGARALDQRTATLAAAKPSAAAATSAAVAGSLAAAAATSPGKARPRPIRPLAAALAALLLGGAAYFAVGAARRSKAAPAGLPVAEAAEAVGARAEPAAPSPEGPAAAAADIPPPPPARADVPAQPPPPAELGPSPARQGPSSPAPAKTPAERRRKPNASQRRPQEPQSPPSPYRPVTP